jgi:hypothetical protein
MVLYFINRSVTKATGQMARDMTPSNNKLHEAKCLYLVLSLFGVEPKGRHSTKGTWQNYHIIHVMMPRTTFHYRKHRFCFTLWGFARRRVGAESWSRRGVAEAAGRRSPHDRSPRRIQYVKFNKDICQLRGAGSALATTL